MSIMLSDEVCARLRESFIASDYTVDGVSGAIGVEAHRALGRNSTVPAVRALSGSDDPLAALTLLWPLQQNVPRAWLDTALPGLVEPLLGSGMLTSDGEMLRAEVDLRPYAADEAALWVVSDLTPGLDTHVRPIRSDFVLGVSSASSTLAQMTVREPAVRALDLGTGCGVQSLHLARHSSRIVATDVNPRALLLARTTCRLNEVEVDLRQGSLYEPVAGERFDLVVTNPPYVMSPPGADGDRLVYREGGMPADGLVEHLVRRVPEVLADGGRCHILANWAHLGTATWAERLATWIEPTGCDAHVVQREVLDPAGYVELWLADAGLAGSELYRDRYEEWLDYFERLGIEAVGLGWISLHNVGRDRPSIRIEDWPYPVEQPIAPTLQVEPQRIDLSRLSDTDLLNRPWTMAADVVEETTGQPGAADPQHIVLRQQRGFGRAVAADTALAGIVGACDGDLPMATLIASVAALLEVETDRLVADVVPHIRDLVLDGLLA